MAGARTGAMAANRLIDAGLDARNPRTATRAIPQGLMSRPEMLGLATGGFALLHIAAWQLNGLALALAPVAMLAVTLYSYTKRFTWGSHWILGLVDGIAPVGGWIAVTGAFSLEAIVLALAVMFWIGGFDVLYGLQDVEFDRLGVFTYSEEEGTHGADVFKDDVPAQIKDERKEQVMMLQQSMNFKKNKDLIGSTQRSPCGYV